jgi:beta-lactamase class D
VKRAILYSIFICVLFSCNFCDSARAEFEEIFGNEDAAFVLYNPVRQIEQRFNAEGCTERYSPCSTFKIPNTLIGLETGVIPDASFTMTWDSARYPRQSWWPDSWAKDHNLTSAFYNSVVWYYQDVAQDVGVTNFTNYMKWYAYGNQDISGGTDPFWLNSSLQISANEQIGWLEKFYNMELGAGARNTDIVKDILIQEEGDLYLFSGKTGSGKMAGGKYVGWMVGYFEAPEEVYFYAMNMTGKTYQDIRDKPMELVRQVFVSLNLLPDRVAER